jgi:P4 family phage/plasmid primase-like protien
VSNYIIEHENIIIVSGKPYIYKNGVYKCDSDGNILRYLIKSMMVQEIITITKINRVYNLILANHKLTVGNEDVNQYPSYWINFKNGMLDVLTGEMHEHSPRYLSINQIPHNYVPNRDITETTFFKFLQSRIPDKENQQMLFEFMGYCMTKDVIFQKFMILFGLGECGKSTIINFTTNMVGKENTCSISLQQLGDRFTTAYLLFKTLNTCGDMTNSALTDSGIIKKLSGDDCIKAEYKGGEVFFFWNHAKMMFSCNELPKVLDDKTNGFYRRLLIVRFSESGEFIPGLREKLSSESEFESVISGCITALRNALSRGKIFESGSNFEEVEQLRADSDTVAAFIGDCATVDSDFKILRSDLYEYYKEYCTEEGRTSMGKHAFFKALRTKGYADRKTNGLWYFFGLDVGWKEIKRELFNK